MIGTLVAATVLDGVERIFCQEYSAIDEAEQNTLKTVLDLYEQLANRFVQGVSRTITQTGTSPAGSLRGASFKATLLREIVSTAQGLALEMQVAIDTSLIAEAERLKTFAITADRIVRHLTTAESMRGAEIFRETSTLSAPTLHDQLSGYQAAYGTARPMFEQSRLTERIQSFDSGPPVPVLVSSVNELTPRSAHHVGSLTSLLDVFSLCRDLVSLADDGTEHELNHRDRAALNRSEISRLLQARKVERSENLRMFIKTRFAALENVVESFLASSRQTIVTDRVLKLTAASEATTRASAPPRNLTTSSFGERGYRESEIAIVGSLKTLHDIALQLQLETTAETLKLTLKDIEQHCFRLAVVGEFKRGKSTFINALLGRPVLPADVLPTTATLNRVVYGDHEGALIRFKPLNGQAGRTQAIPLSELADYVTKLTADSENLAATIEEAVISYPTQYCKQNNVEIIDTPGLNDDAVMTATTKSVLPKVHAAIMLISATAPLGESEGQFLEHLLDQGMGKVVYVATRMDQIDEAERPEILQHIMARIQKRLGEIAQRRFGDSSPASDKFMHRVGAARVFGVSGLQALRARQAGDEALRKASGFDEMEAALEHLLFNESGSITRHKWVHQLLAAAREIEEQIAVSQTQCETEQQAVESAYRINSELAELLRQMAQNDLEIVDSARTQTIAQLENVAADLERDLIARLESLIGDYQIDAGAFAPEQTNNFHLTLATALQTTVMQIAKQHVSAIHQLVEKKLAETKPQLLSTATAFDRVMQFIESSTAGQGAGAQSSRAHALADFADCPEMSLEQLEQILTVPSDWLGSVFGRVRLPVGSFNILNRKIKEAGFRSELKQQVNFEISSRMRTHQVNQRVIGLAANAFWQRETRTQKVNVSAEETRLEVRSLRERSIVLIENRQRELTTMRARIDAIVHESQTMVALSF